MKKSLVALAVLSTVGAGAFAQSSVTLFGVVDLNARYMDNSSVKRYDLATDGIASSRIGFRGVEDLGGGLRGSFWLEGGIAADQGTVGGGNALGSSTAGSNGAAFFNRRATLSLTSGLGELRLGRDYIPTFWNLTSFDPFGTNGVGSYGNVHLAGVGPSAGDLVRANNSIGYFLPGNLGGIYGQAMVAAGEGTPNSAAVGNKYVGGRIGYMAGPLNVAASVGDRSVVAFRGDDTVQQLNVAGSFKFGPANLMAQYGTFKLANVTLTNYLLGATAVFGASTFKAAYSTYSADNAAGTAAAGEADQIAIGYQYDLSRRTALYTTVSRISNEKGAAFRSGGLAGVANGTYTGAEVGVRHTF